MGVEFKIIQDTMRLMNPFKEFSLDEITFEIRVDPLTGETGRIFNLPYKPPDPPDISQLEKRSKDTFCPFCPEVIEKSTPLFPKEIIPEGRIRVGDALLVPNLLPLDRYTGVVILSSQHYIPMEELTPDIMLDAFSAAHLFIRRVADMDPNVHFFNINWNYMPPAGSSIIHPHLQVNCGEIPTNQYRIQMDACNRYHANHGQSFWKDFMDAERKKQERLVGEIDGTFWVMNFVPQSALPDISCIFPEYDSLIRLGEKELTALLNGLARVLQYFNGEKLYSFNVSIYSERENDAFRLNARICPRLLLREIGNSDHTYFQHILKEPTSIISPESACKRLRTFFD